MNDRARVGSVLVVLVGIVSVFTGMTLDSLSVVFGGGMFMALGVTVFILNR